MSGARLAAARPNKPHSPYCVGRAFTFMGGHLSIAAIAWSWKQDLRPTEKFILIAISDHANDEDFTCWPSLTHLEKKTGFNRSTIWRTIDCLVKTGHIGRVGQHPSGATLYKVMVGAQSTQVQTATSLGAGCNVVGAHSNKVGAQDTPNHKNHHESSITIMSGLPPDVGQPERKNGNPSLTKQAIEVLEFLNATTGRNYRATDSTDKPTTSLQHIISRLKTGATVQDCKTLIARKHRDWAGNDKMWPYLRPATLFNATKFEQYLGECVIDDPQKRRVE